MNHQKKLANIAVISFLMFCPLVIVNCSDPTDPEQCETIRIGDTIDRVTQVFGDDFIFLSGVFNGEPFASGTYSDPDVTFNFDESSPRLVTGIQGNPTKCT